jgi:hypothetical protein
LSAGTSATLALVNAGADDFATNVVSYPTLTRVEFAVTDDNADAGADGLTLTGPAGFTIGGIAVVATDFNLGSQIKYTVTAESAVGGASIEAITGTVTQVIGQFSAKSTALLGTGLEIDVEEGRKEFTDGATPKVNSSTDSVTVAIADATGDIDLLNAVAVAGTADYTLSGDFTFLDADSSGAIDAGMTLSGTNAAGLQSTSFTNVAGAAAPQAFTVATDASVVLKTQTFTASAGLDYNTATAGAAVSKFSASGFAAGSWSLNGSSDDIAFLPFGNEYAQSITVTNIGSVVGEITVELTAEGTTYTTTLAATAAAKSVTNISTEVANFATASGITGNARISIVVNAPTADIAVKGLYFHKATQDRVLTY